MSLPSLFNRTSSATPFHALSRLHNDFERFFTELNDGQMNLFKKSDELPSCEITEDKSAFTLKFDMPGIKKEDVKIEMDGNVLTVSAERKEEKKSESKKCHCSEISYGSYERSFTMPSNVNGEKVDAKFDNGVLTLTVPKSESANVKQISVK